MTVPSGMVGLCESWGVPYLVIANVLTQALKKYMVWQYWICSISQSNCFLVAWVMALLGVTSYISIVFSSLFRPLPANLKQLAAIDLR